MYWEGLGDTLQRDPRLRLTSFSLQFQPQSPKSRVHRMGEQDTGSSAHLSTTSLGPPRKASNGPRNFTKAKAEGNVVEKDNASKLPQVAHNPVPQ
jgi:hypothetical protein